MKQKIIHLKTEKESFPLVFNLNVMEEIQEHYGSLDAWANLTDGTEEEPKIKDIKVGLLAMINEGIDIENEDREVKRPFMTSKKLGRFISELGLAEAIKEVQNITTESVDSGIEEPKNM